MKSDLLSHDGESLAEHGFAEGPEGVRISLVDLALLVGQRLGTQLLQLLGAQLPGSHSTLIINLYKMFLLYFQVVVTHFI